MISKSILVLFIFIAPLLVLADGNYIELPMKFDNGLPYVDIQIQNTRFPVLVDLGAANTWLSLDSKAAQKLSVITNSNDFTSYDSCGKKHIQKSITIPKIQIGKALLYNIPAHIYLQTPSCSNKKTEFKIKYGLIGIGFIKNYKVIFDYPNKKIILFNSAIPANYNIEKWQKIRFSMQDKGLIVTNTVIEGKKIKLLWDTGSNLSILKSKSAPKNTNKILELKNLIIDSKNLGKINFLILSNLKMPFDGSIGSDFFQNHTIYIDFKTHSIAIQSS